MLRRDVFSSPSPVLLLLTPLLTFRTLHFFLPRHRALLSSRCLGNPRSPPRARRTTTTIRLAKRTRTGGGASPSPVSAPPPHSASRPPHFALLPSSPPRSTQPLDEPDCWSRSGRHRCRQCVPCSRSEPDFSTPSAASGDVPSVRGRRKYCAGR